MLSVRFIAWVFAALAPLAQAVQASVELPAEAFARHAEFENIKISPDGRHFAATVPRGDSTVLVIIDRSDMRSGAILDRGQNQHVYWFEWANPERIVFKVEQRLGGYDFPVNYGQIFAADEDGRNHIPIFGYEGTHKQTASRRRANTGEFAWGTVIDMLPDKPDKILVASRPYTAKGSPIATIIELDVKSGVSRKLGRLPMRDVYVLTDAEDNHPRFVAGFDEDYNWTVRHRPDGNEWQEAPRLSEMEFVPLGYEQRSDRVYGFGLDEASVRGLYAFDPANGQTEALVESSDFDINGILTDPHTGELLGVYSDAEKVRYHFVDTDNPLRATYESLLKAFPDHRLTISSRTADGSEMILRVSSDRNAGDFFLFDAKQKNAAYLMSSREWLDPNVMAVVEPIRYEARDGMTIHGYLTRPPHADASTALPLVVMPHGGPHGVRDRWHFDIEAQFLANRGYAVLQPNFRGSGGYGKRFLEAGYREWGAKMQDDVTDATRWAIEQGIANPDRICIYGASYGAYAALMGVVREPELYACAIGSAGVYDLNWLHTKGDIREWVPGPAYLDKAVGTDEALLRERSPITYAGQIDVPVLLVHGGRDERAPLAHAKAMRDAMRKAGNEPRWLLFKNEAHGYYDVDNRKRLLEELEAFLDEHIGS